MTDTNNTKPPAFIFGARPKTVEARVIFKSVTGAEVDIPCQFKYRTRKEFAQLWDKLAEPMQSDQANTGDFSFSSLADKGLQVNAERTLEYLTGWPLDLELSADNVIRMFDEEPAASEAFWNAYRGACTEGRLGN